MPFPFLSLPRELRDQIYQYVLISPTGEIQPELVKRSWKGTAPPGATARFELRVVGERGRASPPPTTTTASAKKDRRAGASLQRDDGDNGRLALRQTKVAAGATTPNDADQISLSICRTCKQIYGETRGIFFPFNTFTFATCDEAIRTIKRMGQVESRKIRQVRLEQIVPAAARSPTITALSRAATTPWLALLAKMLRQLASRARHGHLRRLDLALDPIATRNLASIRHLELYETFLAVLRQGAAEARYERSMHVWRRDGLGHVDHALLREIHLAWGGRMFLDDVLVYEGFEVVGDDLLDLCGSPTQPIF